MKIMVKFSGNPLFHPPGPSAGACVLVAAESPGLPRIATTLAVGFRLHESVDVHGRYIDIRTRTGFF